MTLLSVSVKSSRPSWETCREAEDMSNICKFVGPASSKVKGAGRNFEKMRRTSCKYLQYVERHRACGNLQALKLGLFTRCCECAVDK